MKKLTVKIISLLVVLTMMISLAACGGSSNGTTAAAPGETAAETTSAKSAVDLAKEDQETAAEAVDGSPNAPVQQEAPDQESTIITCAVSDPGGFDPFIGAGYGTEYGVYETLLYYGYDGVEPGVIKSYELLDDHSGINVEIYDNVYTAGGYNITMEDVLWSIEKQADNGFNMGRALNWDPAGSTIEDDYHGFLKFGKDYNIFITDTLCHLTVTSKEQYEKEGDGYYLNGMGGTGPYMIDSYKEGVEVRLKKNPYYESGYRTQNVDNIIVKIVPEASQRLLMLESGEIDVLVTPSTNDISYIQGLSGIEFQNEFSPLESILCFNVTNPALADKRVRQAFCLALDVETICESVFNGLKSAAVSVATPRVREWTDDAYETSKENVYHYDLEKAKELLKEAGYENGLELTFVWSTRDATSEQLATVMQGQLLQAGIKLTLEPYDNSSFKALSNGLEGWDVCLDIYKESISVLWGWNDKLNQKNAVIGGWQNDEFQAMLDDALVTFDEDEVNKMIEIFNEEVPHYGLTYNTNQFAYRTGIKDFRTCGDNFMFPGDWTYDYDACDWLFD